MAAAAYCFAIRISSPVGALYKHDSRASLPYTYFSSAELRPPPLGEITLECSRAGASAVALWATQQLFPLIPGGEFSQALDKSLLAARALYDFLDRSENYQVLMEPQLDIVVYAVNAKDAATANARASKVFDEAAKTKDLHLALVNLPASIVSHFWSELDINCETVACLRSCLLKPEHLDWVDKIGEILDDVASG